MWLNVYDDISVVHIGVKTLYLTNGKYLLKNKYLVVSIVVTFLLLLRLE